MSETRTKSNNPPFGALWKKSGIKADGTPYSFLSGNVLVNGQKVYITVNKSKIPDEERKEKKSADYIIYKDDWIPNSGGQTKPTPKAKVADDEPF